MHTIPSPSELAGYLGFAVIPTFVVFGYLLVLLDRRDDRPSKGDPQIGIKLVLWGLVLSGVSLMLGGANSLIGFVLGGFSGGLGEIKGALATLVSGGVVAMAFAALFLPRTNNAIAPQVERYAMGTLAMAAGLVAVIAFSEVVRSLFYGERWKVTSGLLSTLGVYGAATAFALLRHGALSGWSAIPPRSMSMPPGQSGGGYPAAGAGHPASGSGYPPPTGYPPQGGYGA